MLLNLRIVIGHLPDTWIAQSRYDDLSDITTIVIDDRRLPEGVTLDQIITHEVSHARAACEHRQRYAASGKAERDRVYNQAQDYIVNEMLKPSTAIPGTFERKRMTWGELWDNIHKAREDWSPAEAHILMDEIDPLGPFDATGYMVPEPRDEFLPLMTTDGKKIVARALLNGKPYPFKKKGD